MGESYASLEPADTDQPRDLAIHGTLSQIGRFPNIDVSTEDRRSEGNHTDDRNRITLIYDTAAHDSWIAAESPLPELIAHHHNFNTSARLRLGDAATHASHHTTSHT